MDGLATHAVTDLLDLADVDPDSDMKVDLRCGVTDRQRAAQGASRAVERRQQPIAGRIDLPAAIPIERDAHG